MEEKRSEEEGRGGEGEREGRKKSFRQNRRGRVFVFQPTYFDCRIIVSSR